MEAANIYRIQMIKRVQLRRHILMFESYTPAQVRGLKEDQFSPWTTSGPRDLWHENSTCYINTLETVFRVL